MPPYEYHLSFSEPVDAPGMVCVQLVRFNDEGNDILTHSGWLPYTSDTRIHATALPRITGLGAPTPGNN